MLLIVFCVKLNYLGKLTNKNVCIFFDHMRRKLMLLFDLIFQFKGSNKNVLFPLITSFFLTL